MQANRFTPPGPDWYELTQEEILEPDIGAELTGGCYGFATRYMHWPEQ